MVYNFALPPLVLHTFVSGNATALSAWAGGLRSPSRTTTFLNFLDSHDGIGLLGAQDILTREDIDRLVAHTLEHGGLVSYKTAGDEDPAPYELNITWYSALNRKEGNEPQGLKIRRFLASRAVALVLAGVPGIYLHSLFGTHNDHAAVQTGHENRMINRTVVDARSILRSMNHPRAKKYRINQGLGKMIQVRTAHPAFHPQGAQEVLSLCPEVFAVLRTSPTGDRHVLALINVTQGRRRVRVPIEETGRTEDSWVDLLSERSFAADSGGIDLRLQPYEVVWLAPHIDHNLSMLTR